jgi:hypothetical protein
VPVSDLLSEINAEFRAAEMIVQVRIHRAASHMCSFVLSDPATYDGIVAPAAASLRSQHTRIRDHTNAGSSASGLLAARSRRTCVSGMRASGSPRQAPERSPPPASGVQ